MRDEPHHRGLDAEIAQGQIRGDRADEHPDAVSRVTEIVDKDGGYQEHDHDLGRHDACIGDGVDGYASPTISIRHVARR